MRISLLNFVALGLFLAAITPGLHAQDVWVGNSATASNWTDGTNWQSGMVPMNGDALVFQGSNRTTNTNDLPINDIDSFTFNANAAAFTLQGKTLGLLSNGITNNSTNLQTFNFTTTNPINPSHSGFILVEPETFVTAGSGPILIQNNVEAGRANVTGLSTFTVQGAFNTTVSGNITDDPTTAANTLRVNVSNSAQLILSGNNTYSGDTLIQTGTLVVDNTNALGVGNVTLGPMASAMLQTVDNSPRTFSVGKDFTVNGGTLRMQIGGTTSGVNSDLLQVTGDAFLNGGTLQVVRINNFVPMNGDRVTIINTLLFCTRVGQFDTVMPVGFNGLLQPMADYSNPDTVDIVFALAGTFQAQGNTPNQRATGLAVDSAVNDPNASALINFLGSEPLANLPADLDLIAPDELASIYEVGFSQAVVQNNNLQHRMDDIRAGSTGFSSAGYQAPISSKDGKNVISDKNAVPAAFVAAPENRWGVFVTGNGDFVNVHDDDFNAPGYDIQTGNVLLGVDYRIGNHFALGIDGSYASSTADLVNRGRADVDGGKAGAYATVYGFKILGADVHVDGAVGGGWNNYDTNRTGLQGLPVRGSTDGSELNALIAYGGDYHFGHLLVGTWSMVQYTDINLNSFTETGSLAPLRYPDQNQDSFRSTSGLRLAYEAKCGRMIIRPEVRAGWQHEGEERAYPITASFASGAGNPFTVYGPSIGRDSALVDAGVSVGCDRFSAFVYYDGVLGRSNYDNHSISGGVRISF